MNFILFTFSNTMQILPAKPPQSIPFTLEETRGLVNLLRLLRCDQHLSVLEKILYLFLEIPGLLAKMGYMRLILANKLKESHLVDPTLVSACTHLLDQIKHHPDYVP